MSCIFWNCQGLGAPLTIHVLGDILREHRPLLVFLAETKATLSQIDRLKVRWNLNGIGVAKVGNSGGLVMFWQKEVDVDLISFSEHHIDVEVVDRNYNSKWRVTGFYGYPEPRRRQLSWSLLRTLHDQRNIPWLVGGDFNEILSNCEKEGGLPRQPALIEHFKEALVDCGLIDLGYEGPSFTWTNNRTAPDTVRCRLDRACANGSWTANFPHARLVHLSCYQGSDHIPIQLILNAPHANGGARKKRPFRFEATWLRREDCEDLIKQHWTNNTMHDPIESLLQKHKECRLALIQWRRDSVRQPQQIIDNIQKRLLFLTGLELTAERKEEIRGLKLELEKAYEDNDMYWRQRSRVQWIKEGDRNTRFFHSKATIRNRVNRVDKLKDESGCWKDKDVEIERIISEYFDHIFTSTNPSANEIEEVLESVDNRISGAASQLLSMPYSSNEVNRAICQMAPLKSPGPDGLPVIFYSKYRHILGSDVVSCVLDFLNNHKLPSTLNFTYIVLIPKIKNPEKITDYRPISLCNVIYKLGSKVLANRLKLVLDDLISPTQSAFVPKRLISDNILVAYEINHFIKVNSSKRTNYMAIKLDISKAYDRIEWLFLEKILLHFGIPAVFVDLVMLCVSTVSFSFLFNGAQFGYVKPSRGLRQGDPLSPYLFICCAEALTAMITKASDRGNFHGVHVAATAPMVTSLCFADDTLIFGKATEGNSRVLKEILLKYARVSGQEINFEKSLMKFSPSTTVETKNMIHQILGFRIVEQHEKYLGMHASIGRTKKEIFAYLRDRIWAKMKGWGEKQLSKAGKEVLIKSVLQAIPSYVMGCFLLPTGLVRDLEAAIRRFWWGNGTNKGMNWLAWKEMCKPKSDGGLGFRDLSSFNPALVTKQAWRILSNPTLLLSRIIAAPYFPQGDLFSARLGSRPSSTWRSIWQVLPFLRMGTRRRIGDGNDTSVWADPWLRDDGNFRIITKRPIHSAFPNTVADLIDDTTHSWNLETINGVFWPVDINRILEIPLGCGFAKDQWIWHHSRNGKFTVRSCYHMILSSLTSSDQQHNGRKGSHSGGNSGEWKFIWQLGIPPKVKIFLWRLCKNILPTNKELFRRKVSSSPLCGRCRREEESAMHALFYCRGVDVCWNILLLSSNYNADQPSAWQWLVSMYKDQPTDRFLLAMILAWKIWETRNKEIKGEEFMHPHDLVGWCSNYLTVFQNAQLRPSPKLQTAHQSDWVPPSPGFVKINMDAAIPNGGDSFTVSAVARNEEGICVGWKVVKIHGKLKPVECEAMAALKALTYACDKGWSDVIIEGDCLQVLTALQKGESDLSSFGALVEDCLRLTQDLSRCSFSFVKRMGNKLAHAIARISCSESMEGIDLPPHLAF